MRILIASANASADAPSRQEVLSAGLECAAEDCVSFETLPARLARGDADLILVLLEPEAAAGYAALEYCAGHTKVSAWAAGQSDDADQILRALRAGARQFLHAARLRDELLGTLEKLNQGREIVYHRGRLLGVTAAVPGTGVTTVATQLAFALADPKTRRTALAEVCDGVPEIALDLDLTPPHPIAELVSQWRRMDTTLLRQALVEHRAGVSILAHEPGRLNAALFTPEAIRQLLILFRALFPVTVLDLGHSLDAARVEALKLADEIILVVRLDVPSLRLSRNFVRGLEESGVPQEKLLLVANRYGQRGLLAWKKAEELLGQPVREWIPDDPATVNAARNQGCPLGEIARHGAVTRAFGRFAQRFSSRA